MNALADLMKEVAQAQREQLGRARPRAGLEAALAFGARPNRGLTLLPLRARWRRWGLAFSLSACAAAGVVVALRAGNPREVRTGLGESRVLSFPGGSEVRLGPDTDLRLASSTEDGARVHLELRRGIVDVHVVHRDGTSWQVEAGGRVVHVVGTRFREAWDGTSRTFSVEMQEGTVEVTGAGLSSPQRLRAGESLRARDGETTLATRALAAAPAKDENPAPGVARAPSPRESAPSVQEGPRWRELARQGSFKEALRTAFREDTFGHTARLGARDLILLGDVARIAGQPARAERVYREAALRFPSADAAIFSLGLLAFDAQHQYANAARWFATYVARYPTGDLAREAAGRLIEAEARGGRPARAEAAARSYLARYPTGPHARLAADTLAHAERTRTP